MSEPCIKSNIITNLEKDVKDIKQEHKESFKIITERINRHSDKIDKISDNNLVLETILKRLEEDGKEQKKINSEFQKTMLSIQTAMGEIIFSIKELNTRLMETEQKTDVLGDKVEKIEERGKFDFVMFMKNKAIPFLIGGGIIYAILKIIELVQ